MRPNLFNPSLAKLCVKHLRTHFAKRSAENLDLLKMDLTYVNLFSFKIKQSVPWQVVGPGEEKRGEKKKRRDDKREAQRRGALCPPTVF